MRRIFAAAVALLAALLPASARAAPPAPYDPYEMVNRALFALNVDIYGAITAAVPPLPGGGLPADVGASVHNVFRNLRDPIGAAAGLVTGNIGMAWNAGARFAINSTLGVLGTREVAAGMGYPVEQVDLGTALCRAGVLIDPPYMVVPLIGPTNIGDLGGQFATNVALRALLGTYYLPYYVPYYVLDRIDRYMLRQRPAGAPPDPDPYATQRDQYLTQRARRCGTSG